MKHAVSPLVDSDKVIAYLQVKVRLNLHGVVGVESVQQVDEEEYEEKVKRPIAKVNVLFSYQNLMFTQKQRKFAVCMPAICCSSLLAAFTRCPACYPPAAGIKQRMEASKPNPVVTAAVC